MSIRAPLVSAMVVTGSHAQINNVAMRSGSHLNVQVYN
jgi:hypothetical protein